MDSMKKLTTILSGLMLCLSALAQPADKILDKAALLQKPEKLGSIYYAYPGPQQEILTDAPKGYEPFYISHYGRHGSRFQPSDERYQTVLEILEAAYKDGNLTPLGEDVLSRVHKLWIIARGNGGMLTKVGCQQHHDIAARMYERFPEVFASHKVIEARSSVVPRCKASMESFCASLNEKDPALNITQETKQEFMCYIANDTPEQKAFEKDDKAWRGDWVKFEREHINGTRLLKTLFRNPDNIDEYKFTSTLYWLAVGMQDLPTDLSLIELFTPEELYNIWLTINYRMYICNAAAPVAKGIALEAAKPLLRNIIEKADEAIKSGNECATLRFGHDSHLIRLLALMGIEGCGAEVTDVNEIEHHWQDFYISPMAANLQMIFFRNKKGSVIVKFLHNENEVTLPIKNIGHCYYHWNDVKKYLTSKL